MTPSLEDKLQVILKKAFAPPPPIDTSVPPSPEHSNPVGNTLSSAGQVGGFNGLTSLVRPSTWVNGLTSALPTVGKSIATGGLLGLASGAISNTLPIVENSIEKGVGYTPNGSEASNLYSGINPSSLYLDQSKNQQAGSPTQTSGNKVDQALTGNGSIKGDVNSALAGSPWGIGGMALGLGLHTLSNLYSDGKGIYETYKYNQEAQQRANEANQSEQRFNQKFAPQVDSWIAKDKQDDYDMSAEGITKQRAQAALAKQSRYYMDDGLSEDISRIVDIGAAYPFPTRKKKLKKHSIWINPKNITKANYRQFHYSTDKDLSRLMMRQQPAASIIKLFKKNKRITGIKDLNKLYRGTIQGTIYNTSQGKAVAIDKELYNLKKDKKVPKDEIRKILAHEAWHKNVPILGDSEILAHAYGGLKSNKPFSLKHNSVPGQINHLRQTRPLRFWGEILGIGGVGLAGKLSLEKSMQSSKEKILEKKAGLFSKENFIPSIQIVSQSLGKNPVREISSSFGNKRYFDNKIYSNEPYFQNKNIKLYKNFQNSFIKLHNDEYDDIGRISPIGIHIKNKDILNENFKNHLIYKIEEHLKHHSRKKLNNDSIESIHNTINFLAKDPKVKFLKYVKFASIEKKAEFEELKSRIYTILHKYFKIKPPIDKQLIETIPVESSNIKSIGYNPSKSEMQVEFKNNSKYKYPFIAKHTYEEFMNAPSKGKFFHKNIKPIGLYEKLSYLL